MVLFSGIVSWIVSKSTLIVILPGLYPFLEAEMAVLPTAKDVTKPLLSTVAISGLLDSQVTPLTDASS